VKVIRLTPTRIGTAYSRRRKR